MIIKTAMLENIVEDCNVITTIREALLEVHGPEAPLFWYSDKALVRYVVTKTVGLLVSAGEKKKQCVSLKRMSIYNTEIDNKNEARHYIRNSRVMLQSCKAS